MSFQTPILLSAIGALALAGCTTPYAGGYAPVGGYQQAAPYSPSNPPRAQSGAVTGAILGGLIGISSDEDRLEKAAVGAVIGAAAGGAIGATLDRQKAELDARLGSNVDVINTGSELIVRMPQDILFATDSASAPIADRRMGV